VGFAVWGVGGMWVLGVRALEEELGIRKKG
jgi:hypothetical protein